MRHGINKKITLNNEVGPITVNIPPPIPAQVQTVEPRNTALRGSFKDFYHSDIKSFAPSGSSFVEKAANYIKRNEGVKNKMYRDKGFWSIGIGHLITPQEYNFYKNRILSDKEILDLFNKDLNKKIQLAKSHFGAKFDSFSENLKIAIIDGYFRGDLSGSPRARELLRRGNYQAAAKEYLNNDEYRAALASGSGVAKRMQRNAEIMAREN